MFVGPIRPAKFGSSSQVAYDAHSANRDTPASSGHRPSITRTHRDSPVLSRGVNSTDPLTTPRNRSSVRHTHALATSIHLLPASTSPPTSYALSRYRSPQHHRHLWPRLRHGPSQQRHPLLHSHQYPRPPALKTSPLARHSVHRLQEHLAARHPRQSNKRFGTSSR